jgi:RimJ/RimL family protein N-acetyltransferase
MEPPPEPQLNAFSQPIGPDVPGWTPRQRPADTPMVGRFCRVEAWGGGERRDALLRAFAEDDGRMWTYLPWGPFADVQAFQAMIDETAEAFQRFVILNAAGEPLGSASYMRHDLAAGSVEVGAVIFSPRLQRAPAATEAMYLMMRRVFEAGYRRYEWKCDNLNARSRAAALRLGFRFEGVFRQDRIIRGHNRDTAWFSVIDREWPALRRAFELWLAPANFDEGDRQRLSLGAMIKAETEAQPG